MKKIVPAARCRVDDSAPGATVFGRIIVRLDREFLDSVRRWHVRLIGKALICLLIGVIVDTVELKLLSCELSPFTL